MISSLVAERLFRAGGVKKPETLVANNDHIELLFQVRAWLRKTITKPGLMTGSKENL